MCMRWRQAAMALLPAGALALVAVGCGGNSGGEAPATAAPAASHEVTHSAPKPQPTTKGVQQPDAVPNQVAIDNFRFSPRELTVTAGTTVTWVNNDDVPHTATSTAKPKVFDSRTLDTDAKFSHVFTTPGTYDYFCAVHPNMTGRIIVK
jgi:plastocyanin